MKNAAEENTSDRTELSRILDEAMMGISAKERDAVILRFYRDQSLRDVGVALGITEDAAVQRISRAVRNLRTQLRSSAWISRRRD